MEELQRIITRKLKGPRKVGWGGEEHDNKLRETPQSEVLFEGPPPNRVRAIGELQQWLNQALNIDIYRSIG
jgi:hypothetical protein